MHDMNCYYRLRYEMACIQYDGYNYKDIVTFYQENADEEYINGCFPKENCINRNDWFVARYSEAWEQTIVEQFGEEKFKKNFEIVE